MRSNHHVHREADKREIESWLGRSLPLVSGSNGMIASAMRIMGTDRVPMIVYHRIDLTNSEPAKDQWPH